MFSRCYCPTPTTALARHLPPRRGRPTTPPPPEEGPGGPPSTAFHHNLLRCGEQQDLSLAAIKPSVGKKEVLEQ